VSNPGVSFTNVFFLFKARIYVDRKEVFFAKLFSFNVGIGKYNGGGMMQVPEAIPDDGLLDITIIRKMSKIKAIANVKGFTTVVYQTERSWFI